jgi:hypothetical protein
VNAGRYISRRDDAWRATSSPMIERAADMQRSAAWLGSRGIERFLDR